MNKNIYIRDTKIYDYNNAEEFNPATKYPEGLNLSIKSDKRIYDEIRKLLIDMDFDTKNIGTREWNPFKDFINENDNVVIKPNLVQHINQLKSGTTDCLITNFAIIRPIIDYTIKALNGTGSIIVGDAPVQECIFEKVCDLYGLKEGIDLYNENGYKVKLIDFRKNQNPDLKCKFVSLNADSSLVPTDKYWEQYAVTNYDLREMKEHHRNGIHEYLFPEYILNADVIINLPKPKTHRKAGMTACMKNFIGINSKKEYVPHHRNGSVYNHGDEHPDRSIIKWFKSKIKNYTYTQNIIVKALNKGFSYMQIIFKKNCYVEGSWYGNDTIWRTILDTNKAVIYASKNGKMCKNKQRIIFNLADMIISGEKEGPLLPSAKKVGYLVAGFNQLEVDNVICQIMGFNPNKIKYIKNGYELEKYKISENKYVDVYQGKNKVDIKKYNKKFIASKGWYDYLMEDKK